MNVGQLIDQRRAEDHECIVPGCWERAQTAFFTTMPKTVVAGVEFAAGEFVDLCFPHANEHVYRVPEQALRGEGR